MFQTVKGLELEGIAEANVVIHGRRRKASAEMKIELLIGSELKGRAGVQDVLRTPALRKLATILYKRIPAADDLPV